MLDEKNEIEIDLEDIKMIMQEDFVFFEKIVNNCYCMHCSDDYSVTIENYKAYLNHLNDIILQGTCKNCGAPIGRYLETGEKRKSAEIAEHIRLIKNIKL